MFQSELLNNLLNEKNEVDDNFCDICHEPNDDYFSLKLSCSHSFHYECLKKSFKSCDNSCPYCKIHVMSS